MHILNLYLVKKAFAGIYETNGSHIQKGRLFMELTNTTSLNLTPQQTFSTQKNFPRQPGSAYTHLAGVIFALAGSFPLLYKAAQSSLALIACSIFLISMFCLYGASTTYHTFGRTKKSLGVLKRIDHLMIYVLIAGTYTPVCLLGLGQQTGRLLLTVVWSIAAIGIFQCIFFIHCPKWVSAVIYIAMGWCCLLAFPQLLASTTPGAFALLLTGGIIYTIGGVIYALKLPLFDNRHPNFGLHEIFHCFCLGGTLCHFLMIFLYLV